MSQPEKGPGEGESFARTVPDESESLSTKEKFKSSIQKKVMHSLLYTI